MGNEASVLLVQACRVGGDYAKAEKLIKKGADINYVDNEDGMTALHNASHCGRLDLVQLLIDHGANMDGQDYDGNTALLIAVDKGHFDIVQLLIDRGADINKQDKFGWTALHYACDQGRMDVAQLLINKDAGVLDKQDRCGWTALHVASDQGHPQIVQLLLDHGADKAIKNKHGSTPLNNANLSGNADISSLLQ